MNEINQQFFHFFQNSETELISIIEFSVVAES